MTIAIDTNRVGFETLNITQKAEALGLLAPLSDIPTQNAGAYKETPVDVDGEANQEKLVDVRDFGIASVPYYRSQAHTNPTYGKDIPGAPDVNYVREGTGRLLKQVNEILDKLGLELVVVDGHRSPVTQNILFKAFKEKYFEKVHCGESSRTPENSDTLDEKRRFYDRKASEFALDFCSSAENFDEKIRRHGLFILRAEQLMSICAIKTAAKLSIWAKSILIIRNRQLVWGFMKNSRKRN